MKLRKLFSAVLALCLMLSLCVFAHAEGSEETSILETTETDTTDVPAEGVPEELEPEEEPETSEEQASSEEPAFPQESEVSGDPNVSTEPNLSEELPVTEVPAEDSEEDEGIATLAASADVITVAVPSDGRIFINPYNLDVDLSGLYQSSAQIVHMPQEIINYSDFAVTVDVKVQGVVSQGSTATFVSGQPASKAKQVFLYVEFNDKVNEWADKYTDADNQVVATASGSTKANVLTIASNEGEGYFHLSGTMSSGTWENTDTFGAVITYSFSAAPEPEPEPEPEAAEPEATEPEAEVLSD